MLSNDRKLIAVVGATGQQGGAVVRALQASGQFKIQASIATLPRKSSKQIWTARKASKLHLKEHTAFFWSPIFGNQALMSSNRRQRQCALPRMPVSNTLSGQRCRMSER